MDKNTEWTLDEGGQWVERREEDFYTVPPRRKKRTHNTNKEWLREVDRKNQAILNKIATIRHRGGCYGQSKMRAPKRREGLHLNRRKQEWDRIHRENQGILKRLSNVKATLGPEKIGRRHAGHYSEDYSDEGGSVPDRDHDYAYQDGISASVPPNFHRDDYGHLPGNLPPGNFPGLPQVGGGGGQRAFQGLQFQRGYRHR